MSCKHGIAIACTLNTSAAGSGGGMALGRCGRVMDAHPLGAPDALLILVFVAWEALARSDGELGRHDRGVVFTCEVGCSTPTSGATFFLGVPCAALLTNNDANGSLVVRERACLIRGTPSHGNASGDELRMPECYSRVAISVRSSRSRSTYELRNDFTRGTERTGIHSSITPSLVLCSTKCSSLERRARCTRRTARGAGVPS